MQALVPTTVILGSTHLKPATTSLFLTVTYYVLDTVLSTFFFVFGSCQITLEVKKKKFSHMRIRSSWFQHQTSTDVTAAVTVISRGTELSLSGCCPSKRKMKKKVYSQYSTFITPFSISGSLTASLGSQATAFHKTLAVLEATDCE